MDVIAFDHKIMLEHFDVKTAIPDVVKRKVEEKLMKRSFIFISFLQAFLLTGCNSNVNYSISFNSNGGTDVLSVQSKGNTSITMPNDPTKDGYIFDGWYLDNITFSQPFTANSLLDWPLSSNMMVYAKWNPVSFDITYNLDGGINGTNPTSYTIETLTITLISPIKEGYTFSGWFDNAEYTGDTVTEITLGTIGDINLYAKWTINQYTISFNSNGGYSVTSIIQDYNTTLLEPTSPIKEWYMFEEWYSDSKLKTPYTFTSMPSVNITLYAKYILNKVPVTSNLIKALI